jgi:predicted Rossmann fold flavoprotein
MKYDVAIIGGGPAGLMAAGRAGELGARVILLEKNNRPGIKLLSSGGTRCNITNTSDSPRAMTAKYGKNGKFLFSALHRFGPEAVMAFFERRGVKLKTERGGRVFPVSDRSQDVLDALWKYDRQPNVEIKTGSPVREVIAEAGLMTKVVLDSGETIEADQFVIATGGKSYPATGSSGDGFAWFGSLGHQVIQPLPGLSPVILKDAIVAELAGLSLHDIEVTAYAGKKRIDSRFGDAIFTGNGMSGPAIHDLSKAISQALPAEITLSVDLFPALEQFRFDHRLQSDFQINNNKQFKNSLMALLPPKIVPVIIELSGIDPEKRVNQVTREERLHLIELLKGMRFAVAGVADFDKAIVTVGGVTLTEVVPKTMKSTIVDNLFLAGEILDLDGPTGGYNLQVCWSTGFVAGENAALAAGKKI